MYVWDETYYSDTMLRKDDIEAGVTIKMVDSKPYLNVTKPVNIALEKTTAEAEQRAKLTADAALSSRGGASMGMTMSSIWFIGQVAPNKPWDIKTQGSWDGTIGSTYPGSYSTQIYYQEQTLTLEELGNYTFGYIGAALGFPLQILYTGSWVAADMPLGGADWANEYNDWNAVKSGYNAYHNIP
jgi:hypothetical protein